MDMENVTEHTVTLKVRSDVDPAELLDIMIALSENIVEMVEQQCIECWVPAGDISVKSK
tara:strand:- start:145 stop:321 length:177 start_codon:yes stop_codon:yes gene_type:complete